MRQLDVGKGSKVGVLDLLILKNRPIKQRFQPFLLRLVKLLLYLIHEKGQLDRINWMTAIIAGYCICRCGFVWGLLSLHRTLYLIDCSLQFAYLFLLS